MSLRTDLDNAIAKFTVAKSYDPDLILLILNALAAFAESGSYTLPVATNVVLGGVKQGSNVTVAGDGTLTIANTAVTPAAYTNANITVDATGRITAAASGSAGFSNPMTTTGDIIYSSSGSTAARLAIGGANTVLHGGTTPSYSGIAIADHTATGTPSATTFLRGDNTWSTISASPAGSDKQVQFNTSSAFGGDAAFAWDNTAKRLNIGSPDASLQNGALSMAGNLAMLSGATSGASRYSIVPGASTLGFGGDGYGIVMTMGYSGRVMIDGTGNGAGLAVASAVLQLDATNKGLLPPRMTTTQQNAISSPAEGLSIYNSTLHAPGYFDGTSWQAIAPAPIHGNSTTTGAATTAVTVTIGSTMANTNYFVAITPQDLLTAVNYYISAKTTTTFTITFVTALTGSINFDYFISA